MFTPGIPPPREEAMSYLTRLSRSSGNRQFDQMVRDRDLVYRRYGHVFSPSRLDSLLAEDFKEFLLYENNRHWWGIHRHQTKLVQDMAILRQVLGVLLDESRPIENRLDWIIPARGANPLPGLGKAVMTPLLHVVYPDRYAVWNSIAENAMSRLGLWPRTTGMSFGRQYMEVNRQILEIARSVGVDLWTIDSLWWLTELEHEPTSHQFSGGSTSGVGSTSGRRARAPDTFVCSECFQSKALNLRSEHSERCTDCS